MLKRLKKITIVAMISLLAWSGEHAVQSALAEPSRSGITASMDGRYPEASTRPLTLVDLQDKTSEELDIMRNEIYARHSYIFRGSSLKRYFQQQPWYSPKYERVDTMLSAVEYANIDLILAQNKEKSRESTDAPAPVDEKYRQSPTEKNLKALPEPGMVKTGKDTGPTANPGEVYFDFGIFALEEKTYADAQHNFERALQLEPDNPQYLYYLGKTYFEQAELEQALAYMLRAWEADPELGGLQYDLALLHFKMEHFTEAADLFQGLVGKEPDNVMAKYYAGFSFFKLKAYAKAAVNFVAAAEKSPSIKINGSYYAGICYLNLGEYEQAITLLEYVRDNASSTLKVNAEKWLESAQKMKKSLRPLSLYAKVGYRRDDNIQLEPVDFEIIADEGDSLMVGYFAGRYNYFQNQKYILGAGYNHYQTKHQDLERFDLTGSIFHLYGTVKFQSHSLTLNYQPSYFWLDSAPYMIRHQIRPEVNITLNKQYSAKISYSYTGSNNLQAKDRVGDAQAVAVDLNRTLQSGKGMVFAGLGKEVNGTRNPDYDYEQIKFRLGISLTLPYDFQLAVTGQYLDKSYDNIDSGLGIRREETRKQGSVSLSHRFFYDWLSIIGEFSMAENDANIKAYTYRRKIGTVSLAAKY